MFYKLIQNIMNTIIKALNRRYATKKFDPNKRVSQTDLDILFEALRLSPSSFGLQPWKFIHVKNTEIRKELQEASRWQPQITDASDLFVIAAKTNMQESDVEEYIQDIIKTRISGDIDKLSEFKWMMLGTIWARSPEQLKSWNQKQSYITVWVLLTVCASIWIDACPMEWFDPSKYNEILWLDKLWLTATVVVAIWYRSSEDSYANLAKVRFPKDKLVMEVD
jgi:nitroreductase